MDLNGRSAGRWFADSRRVLRARIAHITVAVSVETAATRAWLGYGDPGDCFLVATAHTRGLTLVTRDRAILDCADVNKGYLTVLRC